MHFIFLDREQEIVLHAGRHEHNISSYVGVRASPVYHVVGYPLLHAN